MTPRRFTVQVPLPPWLKDHRFNGRVVLPAVAAIELLAARVCAIYPAADICAMTQARFLRFLEIPPETPRIDVQVELEREETGPVLARLVTRNRRATMTRMIQHCELFFAAGPPAPAITGEPAAPSPAAVTLNLSAGQIYNELVPFGPTFRTLQDQLVLTQNTARGMVLAPDLPSPTASPALLGSPFPMDGAMHAACVHGQFQVDFVPFPVGFAVRTIIHPTQVGERYHVQAHLRALTTDELTYDLKILDGEERVREQVTGLRMRDVSGGRIRPPAWTRTF
jgi:hypothetical protein